MQPDTGIHPHWRNRCGRIAVIIIGLWIVVGCSGPVQQARETGSLNTAAAPAATLAQTPTSTPSAKPDPAVGLSASTLTYSTNTCYTDVQDAQGHVLHGGIVDFTVTVANTAASKSVPIWLRVRPDDKLPSSPMAMEGSVGKSVTLAGQTSGFGGTSIPAKDHAKLHWRVFFEASYVVHYQPTLRYGDPDSNAGIEWDHAFTTINVC